MEKSDKKEEDQSSLKDNGEIDKKEQSSLEDKSENKLKNTEEKLLRAMAEIENQRRRFEKEKIEAFEFGGFNFARESLSLLDNLERAIASFTNDENLKKNKDLTKIVDGLEIVMKDLVSSVLFLPSEKDFSSSFLSDFVISLIYGHLKKKY